MAIPELEGGAQLTVGTKQTKLAIEKNLAIKVFVAQDAQAKIVEPLIVQCKEKGIPVVWVPNMLGLGKACGIQVGAAAAAMVRK